MVAQPSTLTGIVNLVHLSQTEMFQTHFTACLGRLATSQDFSELFGNFRNFLDPFGAQLLAESSQAERSEALPREARQPPKAAGAEGAPEPREGFKQKHGCDSTGRD